MPNNAAYRIPPAETPNLDVGITPVTIRRALAATPGPVASGDTLELLTFERAGRIMQSDLSVSATLGAGCTLRVVVGDGITNRNVSGATTAGAASKVNGVTEGPMDFAAGEKLFLLIGGAAITAGANVVVDVLYANR